MNQIGNKIRKIRELKNIAPKDMADRLNLTPQGYQRIERDEVGVNVERLLEIAKIFDMKPEEVLTFDEKVVFNNHASNQGHQAHTIHNYVSDKERSLYEENVRLLNEQVEMLKEKNKWLEEKVKWLENK